MSAGAAQSGSAPMKDLEFDGLLPSSSKMAAVPAAAPAAVPAAVSAELVPALSVDESSAIAARWKDQAPASGAARRSEFCACKNLGPLLRRCLFSLFPVIEWMPKIDRASFRADVIAGLTVGVMLIPQSMSYAEIAGLEYKYGMCECQLPFRP